MLTLHIEQELDSSSQEPGAGPVLLRSQMHLVDLAGSERYTPSPNPNPVPDLNPNPITLTLPQP